MARKGNPISVRLDLNRSSDSSWFSDFYYGKLVYQDLNLRSYFDSIRPPTRQTFGFRLGRCIILRFPRRTLIHFFLPRRPQRPKRREHVTKDKRVGDRQNESRIRKKQGWSHLSDRQKKNLSKLIGVSGERRRDYIAFLKNSFRKTKLFNFLFPNQSRSDGPTSHPQQRTLPKVRPSLNYSVMQYLNNRKNQIHFDPVYVLNHFVAPGVAEPSGMGRANAQGRSNDQRIRSCIAFFVASEKKCLAEAKKRLTHFILKANDLAGTTKTTISLFPFFGATFFFLRDGVVLNKPYDDNARKKLLGLLRKECWNLMGSSLVISKVEKFINSGGIFELIKGIEMCLEIILRKRRIPYGLNSYLNEVQKMQSLLYNCENTHIESVKIKSIYQSASLIAQDISLQLRNKTRSFRSIFNQIVKDIPLVMKKKGVEGIRISCSGRLKGAEIARTECGKYGKLSCNVFNQKIDYASAEVSTRYGILGVKVWISYKK